MAAPRHAPTATAHPSRRKYSARSANNVLKELREIARLGYTSFSFLDDNFLLDTQRGKDICQGIIAQGHDFRWACEGRVENTVTGSDLFNDLSAAGCDLIMFGIESGSQRILDSMNKKTRLADIEDSVSLAKKAGIGIGHGFFIIGSPDETVEEVRQTFALAERLKINSFNFNSLTAFKGTLLWNDAVARGLINEDRDWDKMFPVHEIYPDVIDTQTLFSLRSSLVKGLIRRKIPQTSWRRGQDIQEVPSVHVGTGSLPASHLIDQRPHKETSMSIYTGRTIRGHAQRDFTLTLIWYYHNYVGRISINTSI